MVRKGSDHLTDRQYHLLNNRYRTLLRDKLKPTLLSMLISIYQLRIKKAHMGVGSYRPTRARILRDQLRDAHAMTICFTSHREWRDVAIISLYDRRDKLLTEIDLYLSLEDFTKYIYLTVGLVEYYGDNWSRKRSKLLEYLDRGIDVAMWDSVISYIQNHNTYITRQLIIDVSLDSVDVKCEGGTVHYPLA